MESLKRGPITICDVCRQPTVVFIEEWRISIMQQRRWPWIYYCTGCKARVGCHPDTHNPLGYMANSTVRKLRARLHERIDPLWQSGLATRTEIYAWIAKELGIEFEACHVAALSLDQLQNAIDLATKYYTLNIDRIQKAYYDRRYYKNRRSTK